MRLIGIVCALLLIAAPVTGAEVRQPVPPPGTLAIVVAISDGTNLLPAGITYVPAELMCGGPGG